jgi:nitrite reductase/ring-hydroxylating ferredoxin subunit
VELTVVGTFRRSLGASVERLLENALDWEHLPWLHSKSFSSIDCNDAGKWGWRATAGLAVERSDVALELLLDSERATWVTRTLDGIGAGTQIWSTAVPTGKRSCDVAVEFRVPAVRVGTAERVAAAYTRLYQRLYDEDEAMMIGRQEALDARGRAPARAVEIDGEWYSFSARCPHRCGPLDDAPIVDGVIQCPWHGYRFDVRSGRNLDGHSCRLTRTVLDDIDEADESKG